MSLSIDDLPHPVRPELVEGRPFCLAGPMGFYVYMLHCRDRTFYVGHTENLDVRLAQHQEGSFGGYTAQKRPVVLVWCEEFPTRYEALAAERRIKGWSRAKKMALIRGDWGGISRLAKGSKGRPSTSSGRTGPEDCSPFSKASGEFGPLYLVEHPATPCEAVESIAVRVQHGPSRLSLRFTLRGDLAALKIPGEAAAARRDRLWRHTCFEAFVRRDSGHYAEFNFSPSGEWAAYRFSGYREAMAPLDIAPPRIAVHAAERLVDLVADVPAPAGNRHIGLSAVIEEKNGRISYWALAHPPGKPDFHHPDCFALELPPARPA